MSGTNKQITEALNNQWLKEFKNQELNRIAAEKAQEKGDLKKELIFEPPKRQNAQRITQAPSQLLKERRLLVKPRPPTPPKPNLTPTEPKKKTPKINLPKK